MNLGWSINFNIFCSPRVITNSVSISVEFVGHHEMALLQINLFETTH